MFFFDMKRKTGDDQTVRMETAVVTNQEKTSAEQRDSDRFLFSCAVVSDIGCLRTNNEDNYLVGKQMNEKSMNHSEAFVSPESDSSRWQIAGVFDGMGGGEMGELASREAAEMFLSTVGTLENAESREKLDQGIRKAFLAANNRIIDHQKKYKIFGTTGTVLCSDGMAFKLYHLGDSRGYLFRKGVLMQLTKDQTLAQMKLEVGMYTADDPAQKADKHKLTEYIGRDRTKENLKPVESYWIPIESGDHILLCSDGLYDMCSDVEIADILGRDGTLEKKAEALVEEARAKGGEDNITCIVTVFG